MSALLELDNVTIRFGGLTRRQRPQLLRSHRAN